MSLSYDNLTGKLFLWGTDDCFSLVRKFYKQNFDISIRNYARPSDWSSDKVDLMRMLPEKEGFETIADWKVKDLRPGDVLAIAVGESNPNHFAVITDKNTIVHHLYGRMSSEEEFRDFWRNQTCFILRHPDVPDLREVYPDVDIMDLIRARNAPPTE